VLKRGEGEGVARSISSHDKEGGEGKEGGTFCRIKEEPARPGRHPPLPAEKKRGGRGKRDHGRGREDRRRFGRAVQCRRASRGGTGGEGKKKKGRGCRERKREGVRGEATTSSVAGFTTERKETKRSESANAFSPSRRPA